MMVVGKMSQYIPEICNQYLKVCTAETVELGYFQMGFVIGVILTIILGYLVLFKKIKKKTK